MLRTTISRRLPLAYSLPFAAIRPSPRIPPAFNAQRVTIRSASTGPVADRIRTARSAVRYFKRKYPFEYKVSIGVFVFAIFGFGSVFHHYFTQLRPINVAYPEPVANALRRALFYSTQSPNPKKANAYYQQALQLAQENGMNPNSDEVLGIYVRIAEFYEGFHQYEAAVDLLEGMVASCERWIDLYGEQAELAGTRTRLLKKIAATHIKLGALYSLQYINNPEAAEKNLVQGVEIMLSESIRREKEGVKPGEGEWASQEEIGGSLEALAHSYEEKSKHNLAAPLFLRAITLSPPPCHAVVLMNNLATSLAQTLPEASTSAPTSRAVLIANARSWAERALSVGQGVAPPERTEECDVGCAVATHNLGEFAEMEGLIDEAKKRYTEATSLSKAVGFQEGVTQAEDGLRRLKPQ